MTENNNRTENDTIIIQNNLKLCYLLTLGSNQVGYHPTEYICNVYYLPKLFISI